jgi:hypothetical protein
MKFWPLLRWFAALAFLALVLCGWWASDDGRPAGATESSRSSIFNL